MDELPAVVLLQRILNDAIARNSTDVHLHVHTGELVVNFRIGGQLLPFLRLTESGAAVVRRIKALARMDVADTRVPQDGAFVWTTDAIDCDVRAAIVPTIYGEAVVLRLLPRLRAGLRFTDLGLTDHQSNQLTRLLADSTGLVLAAGPTGSGKTTTLYAMMTQLARWGRQVVSIEDPVEMQLHDCRQVEVREKLGITFDSGLRALLRQDPDVIMVGEIRDPETARVALRAAVTGHLVLSTTHARDVVGAALRLVDLGANRVLVGELLRAVVFQSLVSRPCSRCAGSGCEQCQETGVSRERIAEFTLATVDIQRSTLIASSLSWSEVRARWAALDAEQPEDEHAGAGVVSEGAPRP